MSTAFYERLRDVTVPSLLTKFKTGDVVLFKQTTTLTDNLLKPYDITETEYERDAVVFGFPAEKVDGELIQTTDLQVIFGASELSVKPTRQDRVRIDGVHYAVEKVEQVPAAGTAVLFLVQARLQVAA